MSDNDAQQPGDVRFSVSAQLFAYLRWLKENTLLGKSENDVAKQVLTQRLTEMRGEDYRDKKD